MNPFSWIYSQVQKSPRHMRRMETEAKANVVASVCSIFKSLSFVKWENLVAVKNNFVTFLGFFNEIC